jgi:hypothetical protein
MVDWPTPVGLVEVHLHAGKAETGDLRHGVVDNLATQMVEMVAINDVGRIGAKTRGITLPQSIQNRADEVIE